MEKRLLPFIFISVCIRSVFTDPGQSCARPPEYQVSRPCEKSKEFPVGTSIKYCCDDGYQYNGDKKDATCLLDPVTNKAIWDIPLYECHRNLPPEKNVTCPNPKDPVDGKVMLGVGGTSKGSIIRYSCNKGATLIGVKSSYCTDEGSWSSEPPICGSVCVIPFLGRGKMGEMQISGINSWLFVQRRPGSLVKPGDSLLLRCNPNFELPVEELIPGDVEIVCQGGILRPKPACHPAWCRSPLLDNGIGKPPTFPYSKANGSVVEYEDACLDKGKTLHKKSALCHFGTWKVSEAVCQDTQCRSPLPDNGIGKPPTFPYSKANGSVVEYEDACLDKGKTLRKKSALCHLGTWEVSEAVCQDIPTTKNDTGSCNYKPGQSDNYTFTFFGNQESNASIFPHGSVVTFGCKPVGMVRLHGPAFLSCISGSWKPSILPKCILPNKGQEVLITIMSDKGYYEQPGDVVVVKKNSKLTIKCHEVGKKSWPYLYHSDLSKGISGKNETVNGRLYSVITIENMKEEFSGTYICSTKVDSHTISVFVNGSSGMCLPPGEIKNGYVEGVSTKIGDSVRYRCNRGYRVIGVENATCQRNGEWSSRAPYCLELLCPLPSQLANGETNFQSRKVDSIIEYKCNDGYKLTGSNKSLCEDSGKWSADPPKCEEIVCPLPLKITNGEVHFTSVQLGSQIEYTCRIGYRLIGNTKSQCTENGNWSTEPPTCEVLCAPPEEVNNGYVEGNSTKIGDSVIYRCKQGYRMFGVEKATCQRNGHWSSGAPFCIELLCPLPPRIANGETNFHSLKVGSIIEYNCNDGYKLTGSNKSQCEDNGKWSVDPPKCEEIVCPLPLKIRDGEVSFSSVQIGSEIEYTCHNGYRLVGSNKLKCTENGSWTSDPPTCEVTCAPPEEITNGYVEGNATKIGDSVTYRCKRGYRMFGVEKATCQKNGHWSSGTPFCIELLCPLPVRIANGETNFHSLKVDSVIEYKCNDGYKLIGSSKSICQDNGKWSADPLICEEIVCPLPLKIRDGKVSFSSVQIGSEIEYTCHNGYRLIGSNKLKCTENGTWSSDPPTCEVTCAPPEEVINGYMEGNSTNVGDSLTYRCKRGYRIVGIENVTCQKNGQWSSGAPVCVELFCPLPPEILNGEVIFKSLNVGSLIEYKCIDGYKLIGSNKSLCEDSGKWSVDPPSCEEIFCPLPIRITNGEVYFTSVQLSSEIEYTCHSGYRLIGISKSKCVENGNWSHEPPVCEAIMKCPPLKEIENGYIEGNSTDVGTSAIYKCKQGYRLLGKGNAVCQRNGQWSSRAPACIELLCSRPPEITNGKVHFESLRFRSIIEYKCNDGFKLTGSSKLLCEGNGKWNTNPPICEEIYCPIPTKISNGEVYFTSLRLGSEIEYTCYSGYKLVGINKSRCIDNGTWSNSPPICEDVVKCPLPQEIENGYVEWNSTNVGSSIVYKCKRGYRLIGVENVVCQRNGQWSSRVPLCIELRCSVPPRIINGDALFKSLNVDSIAEYSCRSGYKLTGKNKLRCLDNGKWSSSPPVCEEIFCSIPPKIPNGEAYFTSVKVGSEVEYRCYNNYNLIGSSSSRCTSNGNWSNNPPLCEAKPKCELPWDIENGYKVVTSTDVGGVVVFKCRKGYKLVGAENITCEPNGHWSFDEPECVEIHCLPPPAVSYAEVNIPSLTFGSIVEYTCDNGYELIGNRRLICNENGHWFDTPPRCKEILCPVPADITNGEANFFSLRIGSEIKYRCHQGYELIGSDKSVCKEDGKWSNQPPLCRIKCIPPHEIANGFKVGDSTSVGSSITYKCNKGYRLQGEGKITCQENGRWSNREPSCSEAGCVAPPRIANGEVHFESLKFGSEVEYKCNFGYEIIGISRSVCRNDGEWSNDSPICQEILCPIPNDIVNGQADFVSLKVGSEIKYRCHQGFHLIGNSKSVCQENGKWSKDPPICKVKCAPPQEIANGHKEGSSTDIGSSITYKCNKGYKLEGEGKLTCQENGHWSNKEPSCSEILCPVPPKVPNAEAHFSSLKSGSKIEYICDLGYTVVGKNQLICNEDEKWSGQLPECREDPTRCSADELLSILPEDVFAENITKSFVPSRTVILLECDDNILVGNKYAVCSSDGSWKLGNPKCVSGCYQLERPPRSSLIIEGIREEYEVGDELLFSCPRNHILSPELERIVCLVNGWSDYRIPGCFPVRE